MKKHVYLFLVTVLFMSCGKSNSKETVKGGPNDSTRLSQQSNGFPLYANYDTKDTMGIRGPYTAPLDTIKGKLWMNNYLTHPKRLSYNLSDPNKTIKGFRIEKAMLDDLFASDTNCKVLYVFFGAKGTTANDSITMIFSTLNVKTNARGIMNKGLLYDYVDPCPSKCPDKLF